MRWSSSSLSTLANSHDIQDEGHDYLLDHANGYRTSPTQRPMLWLALHAALLSIATVTFMIGSARLKEASSTSLARDPLGIIARQGHRQLEGDFDHQTVFKGQPRPDLDEAWDNISKGQIISINEDVFPLLNKTSEDAAQLPATRGGGYIASLEMFHQLHCLVRISMFVPIRIT
jgi:hypothetical protein